MPTRTSSRTRPWPRNWPGRIDLASSFLWTPPSRRIDWNRGSTRSSRAGRAGEARNRPAHSHRRRVRGAALDAAGGFEHREGVDSHPFVACGRARPAPVDRVCPSPRFGGHLVQLAFCGPPAAGKLLGLKSVEGLRASGIANESDFSHVPEPSQDVIVVVQRIVQPQEFRVHDPTAVAFQEQFPTQVHLRGAQGRLPRRRIAGPIGIDREAQHGMAALPEGRGIRVRIPIAIPPSIGPLPMKKSFGKVIRALVRNPQFLEEVEGVALLRGTSSISPPDPGNPLFSVGFRFRGRIEFPVIDIAEPSIKEPIPEWEQGATRARIADVRQAREDPMGALPLGVGVSDAVSNAWPNETREERANSRRTANPPLEGRDSLRRATLSEY